MLLGGFVCAVAAAFFLNSFLSGPRLGLHYDFLLDYKSPIVSGEILIINTDEFIEGSDLLIVLMTLTEMEASNLILTGRVSPSSSPIAFNDAEVRGRFNDEYNLLSSNIRNLFEGIRMGYVNPAQAPLFVEQVVELANDGKDRLISALIDRDEDLLRSFAVFGNFINADYKPRLDPDGKLRRVNPIDTNTLNEHPVYEYLKTRYAFSQIESTDLGKILWLRSQDAKDLDIPLDREGNIITGKASFRGIDIELFRLYDETDKNMRDLLKQANELRVFSQTSLDRIPLFLDNRSQLLLEELYRSPNNNNRNAWITSRVNYLKSLDDFFSGNSDSSIINQYEEQISDIDSANIELLNSLITRKNSLAEILQTMRNEYNKLSIIHSQLKKELELSLCIMGPKVNSEYSALLANVLITGAFIKPAYNIYTLFWSITITLLILIIIFYLRPLILLPVGIVLSILSAFIFIGFFIFNSFWIDPLMVLIPSLTGTLIIFICKCIYLNLRASNFRMAYRSSVSKEVLRDLIKTGRPRLTEVNTAFAAVIAVKENNLLGKEDNEKSQDAGKVKRSFYSLVKKIVFNAGGVIAGYEGDTVLVCFGSPIDKSYHPINKACNFVREIIRNEKISWRFGIDVGNCSFAWSPETGFSVNGRPAVRARILVSKTSRFKVRALVTETVLERTNKEAEKIGALYDENDTFYELPK